MCYDVESHIYLLKPIESPLYYRRCCYLKFHGNTNAVDEEIFMFRVMQRSQMIIIIIGRSAIILEILTAEAMHIFALII